MKKIIGSAAVLSALLLLSGCGAPAANQNGATSPSPTTNPSASSEVQQQPASNPNMVNIQNFSFNPGTLTSKKGTTVTWTNGDSAPHQIKSATFNSSQLAKGQSFSFTFSTTGTFDYSCAIHPSMLGKIVVE